MKKPLRLLFIALLTPCLITPAYSQATAQTPVPQPSNLRLNLDLLSDTNGVDLGPYVRTLISDLRKHWLPLVEETENQRPMKQEETIIEFTIAADGGISAMQLKDSTKDTALDKAAWNAAKSTSYLPPPTGMKDSNLKLRVHFIVN
jgi:TonB family protein